MLNQFNASLWGDEAFSAILSQKSIPDIITTIARDTSPPLYNILEHIWFRFLGNSEISIRSLSFLFFLIAIFFVYKIGEYFFGKKTGLMGAILTFLNPFFFTYAFEGRMYSLLAATVVASFYFFIKKKHIPFIIATTLALYTHHFAIFALAVLAAWFLFKPSKKLFLSFLAIGLLYIPWIIPLYNQTKMVGTGFWLGTPNLFDLRNLIYKYLAQGIDHSLATGALWITLIILVLRKWQNSTQKTIFLLLWFLLPILLDWLISQKFTSVFFDRYLLYTIPAAMLILASNQRKTSQTLTIVLLALFAIITLNYFTHPTKKPFRDLATYVLETKKGDDYLINWNGAAHHLWESKYYSIPAPIYLPEGTLPYFAGTALMTREDTIKTIPKNINRVGVITSSSVDEVRVVGYTKKDAHTFGDLTFIWLSK